MVGAPLINDSGLPLSRSALNVITPSCLIVYAPRAGSTMVER